DLGGQGGGGEQGGAVSGERAQVRAGAVGGRRAGTVGVGGEDQPVPVPGDVRLGGEHVLQQALPRAGGVLGGRGVEGDRLPGDPQLDRGAALIVLPSGLVTAPRDGDHGGAVGVDRGLGGQDQGQQLGPAIEVDRPHLAVAGDRRGVARAHQHPPVGQPARYAGGDPAPGGQATRRGGAIGRDQPDLGAAGG